MRIFPEGEQTDTAQIDRETARSMRLGESLRSQLAELKQPALRTTTPGFVNWDPRTASLVPRFRSQDEAMRFNEILGHKYSTEAQSNLSRRDVARILDEVRSKK